MSDDLGDMRVEFSARLDGLESGAARAKKILGEVDDVAKQTGGGFKDLLHNATSFATGMGVFNVASDAVGFLKEQLGGVFQESIDAQAGMAQTNAVLKSTHDASGETANAVADLAGQYSHLTKFSDDTVQSAENMLLTFTNIGQNVFPQATKTVLDMSQALGQDTKSSAIQLGKALNDPIQGVTALQRVGVTFTQTQKDQIKQFMDTNQIAKAQGVILKELQKEFGGTAEAAGKTFGGQMAIANQYMDDFKQTLGDDLMPLVTDFLGEVEKEGMPILKNFSDWFTKEGTPAIEGLAGEVGPLVSNVEDFAGSLYDTVNKSGAFQAMLQTVKDLLPDVKQDVALAGDALENKLLPPVLSLIKNFSTWIDKSGIAKDALHFLGDAVSTVAGDAGGLIQKLSDLFGWLNQNKGASDTVRTAIEGIGAAILALKIVDMGKNFYDTIIGMGKNVTDFVGKLGTIKDKLGEVKDFFMGKFKGDSEAALTEVGTTAKTTGTDVATIGKSAQTSAAEVETAAAEEETALSGVAARAETADVSVAGIGPAAEASAAEAAPALAGISGGFASIAGLTALIPLNIMGFQNAMDNAWNDLQHQDWSSFFGGMAPGNLGGSVGTDVNLWQHLHQPPAVTFTHVPGARGYASGVSNAPGGWAMVGERGPELMYVPQGSQIYPNGQSMGMASSGSGGELHVHNHIYFDGREMAGALAPEVVSLMRTRTGART